MPIAIFKSVREVNSEDPTCTAENLLHQEPGKKWKTKTVGEKTAYCILELNRPMQIIGIDIGNEHSAFVEVLVSNSGCRAEDFKEILITCSFMTPFESKNSTNTNRVRCFNKESLVSSVAKEKWHLLKIICTQPFNKHCQYGLSFIKVHVAESIKATPDNAPNILVPEKLLNPSFSTEKVDTFNEKKTKMFAKFGLREESPDSESESSAALFNRWKKTRQSDDGQTTAAAAIRQASTKAGLIKLSQSNRQIPSVKNREIKLANENINKVLDRNRDELAFGADEDELDAKSQLLSKHIEAEKKRLQSQKEEISKKEEIKKEHNIDKGITKPDKEFLEEPQNIYSKNETPSSSRKRRSSPDMKEKQHFKKSKQLFTKYRPFNRLLEGVVLVISGIQNPDRADLRSKALAMGAKYKADWESGCTHLICAFKNTPKYNQVKGKGKIVMRSWIEKCFVLKKYLPWRRYALDSDEQSKPESDTEIVDESLKPEDDILSDKSDGVQRSKMNIIPKNSTKEPNKSRESIEQKSVYIDSGSDTDDYIEDIKKKNKDKENAVPAEERDVYDVTTEEEDFAKEKTRAALMFFKNLKFKVSEYLENALKDQIVKCIQHYGGSMTPDVKDADYFVVEKGLVNKPNFSGEIVSPQWVLECNDMEQKVATKPYLIVKN